MKIWPTLRTILIFSAVVFLLSGGFRCSAWQAKTQAAAPVIPFPIDVDKQLLAVAPVDANWRFHAGDDAQWSQRNFDDSGWPVVQPRKDWTTQGYAATQSLAWFRFRLRIPARMQSVVIQMPRIDRNYQLFADGMLIAQVGKLPPQSAESVTSAPRLFTLPVPPGAGPRDVQIALRLSQEPKLAGVHANALRGRVNVGDAAILSRLFATGKAASLLGFGSEYTQDVIAAIVGGAGLLLFLLTRQKFYLWFACSMMISAASLPWRMASEHFGFTFLDTFNGYMLMDLLSLVTEALFLFGTLNIRNMRIRILVLVLGILGEAGPLLLLLKNLPEIWADTGYLVFMTAAQFLLVGFLLRGWRRGNQYAKLLFFPYLLSVMIATSDNLGHALVDFNVPHGQDFITRDMYLLSDPFRVSANDVGSILSLLGLLTVLVVRFAQTSREQQRLATALQAAHDIQHRLVPVDIPSLGGLQTAIVYLAAEEVGGDFCQVLPRPDGSIFVAIGDVSGKGLQAAMLSSVAVGAIRAMADEDIAPALALQRLNNALLRTENAGFITCLCLVLNAEGEITIANAGHLSPYLDGVELPLAADLPLGILRDLKYEQATFVLPASARLTLLSDGVVEARSRTGELFGFDRTSQVSQLPAAEIAAQAHKHGQEDDITIITLDWRAPVRELAMA